MVTGQKERRRSARFGAYLVSLVQTGPLTTRLPGDNFGHPWRAVRLMVVLDGEVTLKTGGTIEALGPRGAVLAVGWRPLEISTQGALVVEVDIAVERTAMRGTFDEAPLTVWGPEAVLPGATASALRELVCQPGTVPEVRAETVRVVEQLVGAMATSRPETRTTVLLEQVERSRVVQYIAAHHAENDLTPASIATHFGVSTRTLHRLFEGEERTVCGWISHERLRSALARLHDPRYAGVTLEDLAELCGYGSALALRRAVQAATGSTPSELRSRLAS
ncbi:helix-turn-helix transcriptional regulator [Xylanimonas protaetiae]|uniref:AraC family transcriptional regulator n=1 Tax=Xylanimonas protaetiae TaxID=2509457 RepID=A0A4P6F2G4_9MICO|nr:AraC family transcriptional regulator [Xylanimonas protaetiae]QAY69355.1 AraC family transcriptional regulator [Xylanimonas protaetiae]